MEEIRIDLSEEEIASASKLEWKKYVKDKFNEAALEYLTNTNSTKSKTKHIQFHTLKLSDYLLQKKIHHFQKQYLKQDLEHWKSKVGTQGIIQIYCVLCVRSMKKILSTS